MTDSIATYAISALASSIHYDCKKHIYLLSKKRESSDSSKQIDEIGNAHKQRGNEFEQKLFERHQAKMVDHTYSKDFRKVLQEAQPDTYLYQLKCSLPESFYEDVIGNTKAYRIKNFIPDFLYIKQDKVTKKRKIMIIDAKSSEEMTKSHQFQVASYAFFLSYLIEDIRNLEIDALGGVWLPSDQNTPVTFRIDFQLSKIRQVYTDSLVKISADPNPEWYLNKKCATCPFINKCKADAAGTLRSIPYMNETKAKSFKQDNETDIEDLTELLGELNIESTSSFKNTSFKNYVEAFEHKKPRFLGYSTVSVARETDHAIYIYFQIDAYSKRPFVYGIEALDVHQNKVVESAYSVKYNEHLESELKTYGQFVDQFIANLMHVLDFMNNHQSRCLFYVYSDKEKKEIRNFLYNLITSEGGDLPYIEMDRRKEIILNATKCLMVLFPDMQLLGLPGITSFPDMDSSAPTSVGRFVSIERILEENVALGISGYYRLSEVIQWMSRNNKDTDSDLASAFNGMSLEEVTFGRWKDSGLTTQELLSPGGRITCGTELLVAQRFTWLQDILSVYWDLATDYMRQHQVELYPLICTPFKWPTLQDYKHPLLAKLVFFKQLECIKSCDQLRMDRIRDLSKLDNGSGASLGSLVLEFRSMLETGSQYDFFLNFSVTSLSPTRSLQEQLEKLKFDNWRRYILVPDTRDGILEAIQYSDLLYMSAGKYQKKGIRCVDVKSCKGNDICLVGSRISSRQKRWRLYERYMDFTTNQCVDALKSIDNEPFSDDIVKLIDYPNQWAQENVADEMNLSTNTNDGLNAFFQHVYGPEYTSRRPSQKLQLDWSNLPDDIKATKRLQQIQSILDPNKPIALVKVSSTSEGYDAVKHEARIVCDIVTCYLASCTDHKLQDSIDEPKVMIVTPHHQQRIAIQNITGQFSKVIKVDTVEKMQGQECDLIIACFSFAKIHTNNHEFLRDFRRWNVALSRAKCKVIVLTVESLINPEPQGIFRSFSHRLEPTDGWALLCLLQQWATKQNSDYEWRIDE
ncbi:hypothetical protein A0J61_04322 [Choanephora cucurbitarum]|uniref:Uncharacterized protein n=1 Tax=Choanephora cucurbitarum TaxID=101091 RepID=A0A1C7NF06_9FUNG|nr:hypothetical protein A0J61_04322 [Choanephora cucurbitarum]